MSAPPVPPRPYELSNSDNRQNLPPPLPPLPPDLRIQAEKYVTPSAYELESPPHFENPLIAPRPHRVDKSIPVNMARTLDEQASGSGINYSPGFMIQPNPSQQGSWIGSGSSSAFDLNASIANLSLQSSMLPPPPPPPFQPPPPQQQPQHQTSLPPRQLSLPPPTSKTSTTSAPPSLTAPLPQLAQLQQASAQIQSPTHDPALKAAWCRDVFFLLDRAQGNPTDPIIGPLDLASIDPVLARLAQIAVPLVLQLATSWTPPPSQQGSKPQMPAYVAESIFLRATLEATGAFPEHVRHNPRTAFRDFEAAGRGGFAAAWFRLGRDYENFNDHARARDCFERGAKMGVESCIYRMGMAHLLGQLSLPPSPPTALPLLHRAALLASLTTPQPAYVYALLLLSEFTLLPSPLPPSLFSSLRLIPSNSSPTLEARVHLERAAYLHFPAAQYKLGHAYEFAEPPFGFDPLLSVQYYSLASQQGEVEADMALSKWFLCGSGGAALSLTGSANGGGGGGGGAGGFEKDEGLALTFADKAARKGLPSAEFAMGYYAEVGVGQARDVGRAVMWYERAKAHGNPDAPARLLALSSSTPHALSRQEHDTLTEAKLVRRRTLAAQRAETQPLSPPWEGRVFPTMAVVNQQEQEGMGQGQGGGGGGQGGQQGGQGQGRRRQDGRTVVDVIRKNSVAPGYASSSPAHAPLPPAASAGGVMQSIPIGGRMYSQGQGQGAGGGMRDDSPGKRGRYDSSGYATPQQQQRIASPGQRTQSPGGIPYPANGKQSPGRSAGRLPISGSPNMSASGSTSGSASGSPGRTGGGGGQGDGRSRLERMRLNLDDPSSGNNNFSSPPPPNSNAGLGPNASSNANGRYGSANGNSLDTPLPLSTPAPAPTPNNVRPRPTHTPSSSSLGGEKRPQTFAEMGIHGAKAEEKDCVIM